MATPLKPDRCARCGTAFECGRKAGKPKCWCEELPPALPVSEEGCLCRPCLEKAVAEKAKGRSGQAPPP